MHPYLGLQSNTRKPAEYDFSGCARSDLRSKRFSPDGPTLFTFDSVRCNLRVCFHHARTTTTGTHRSTSANSDFRDIQQLSCRSCLRVRAVCGGSTGGYCSSGADSVNFRGHPQEVCRSFRSQFRHSHHHKISRSPDMLTFYHSKALTVNKNIYTVLTDISIVCPPVCISLSRSTVRISYTWPKQVS